MRSQKGEKPRLVHRLDRETSGVLVVARTRGAAQELTKAFRHRTTEKFYWAICRGVPRKREAQISTYLLREQTPDGDKMRVARHGERGADHAVTKYRHPILGDPKYFDVENWEFPGGIQKRLHLHARRIRIPHPSGGGMLEVKAPLPPHMVQTFNLLGLNESDAEDEEFTI
ncbi:Ribosomal large subunit pseudouridine synthase C [Nymphon striatum]|nr:Ribosomal large subunit pseudouridine synthase C [Nymphon striatum]